MTKGKKMRDSLAVFSDSLFFDAYAVSVYAGVDPGTLLQTITKSLDLDIKQTAPKFGYLQAYALVRGDVNHALFQFGGGNVGKNVYVSFQGRMSHAFYEWVQSSGYSFSVLRADVAFDSEGSVFDSVARITQEMILDRRLKSSVAGDWVNQAGRTLYIGSRKSVCFGRIYEKSKQLGLPDSHEFDRIEFEFKPDKKSRKRAASLSPVSFIQTSPWAVDLCNRIFSAGISPSDPLHRPWSASDHDRSFGHLCRQYRATLKKELDNSCGCLDTFLRNLFETCPDRLRLGYRE